MPQSWVVPTNIPTLHLYRQILREITYLPPAFSSSISTQVKHLFHKHADSDKLLTKRLSRARMTLRTIRAANNGDADSMQGLISKGFGRSGKRRRELLSQFAVTEGPGDSATLEAALEAIDGGRRDKTTTTQSTEGDGSTAKDEPANGDLATSNEITNSTSEAIETLPTTPNRPKPNAFLGKWDREKLKTFLRSQQKTQEQFERFDWGSKPIRSMRDDAEIPKQNTWGREPAESLKNTKTAKWWKRNSEKILPPIGKSEWDILQQLSGVAQRKSEWKIPAKRTPAQPLSEEVKEDEEWNWQAYASQPTNRVERPTATRLQQRFRDPSTSPYTGRQRGNQLTDRWFRRAYREAWAKSAFQEQDPKTLKSTFTWGKPETRIPAATKQQSLIFEGVDAKGKRLDDTPAKPAKP